MAFFYQGTEFNSDRLDLVELPSLSPRTSKSTLEYRTTSPLRPAHMRPKLKAAPMYIQSIAIIEQKQYSQLPVTWGCARFREVYRDEAWPMNHVWPISERFMLGWSGDM